MKRFLVALLLVATVMATPAISSAAGMTFGAGLHYLYNMGDIDEAEELDLSKNSFGLIGSLMFNAGLINVEGQVEYIFDYLGSDESMTIPSAWALIGGLIYGGAGIGIGYIDGDWQSDPFYALRAGVNLPLGGLGLDMYATFQFWSDDELEDLTGDDLDSLTFAAILRFGGN